MSSPPLCLADAPPLSTAAIENASPAKELHVSRAADHENVIEGSQHCSSPSSAHTEDASREVEHSMANEGCSSADRIEEDGAAEEEMRAGSDQRRMPRLTLRAVPSSWDSPSSAVCSEKAMRLLNGALHSIRSATATNALNSWKQVALHKLMLWKMCYIGTDLNRRQQERSSDVGQRKSPAAQQRSPLEALLHFLRQEVQLLLGTLAGQLQSVVSLCISSVNAS